VRLMIVVLVDPGHVFVVSTTISMKPPKCSSPQPLLQVFLSNGGNGAMAKEIV
jgi:hypothetical protein